ncbi:MAG TPA: PIN domain-containing protein [Lacibacter sp.]|nr:PIN domain-containing protein [Lacibacter sp.]HMO89710.1 PIN domain-containing protein [Lacibacter sp.]HMP86943.1 PIN domain-containing protein [Lacibacter sp.]
MKKIIVDTNIIFSCLLNSHGTVGDLLFNSDRIFDFYSNQYMRFEIRKHWNKLLKVSKLSETELHTAYESMLTRLTFVNEELIPQKDWEKAEQLVGDIDPDDTDFVALTRYLKGSLWTGDKLLYEGLKVKRFKAVYNTHDMIKLRERLNR